jgi:hypothetical protein
MHAHDTCMLTNTSTHRHTYKHTHACNYLREFELESKQALHFKLEQPAGTSLRPPNLIQEWFGLNPPNGAHAWSAVPVLALTQHSILLL